MGVQSARGRARRALSRLSARARSQRRYSIAVVGLGYYNYMGKIAQTAAPKPAPPADDTEAAVKLLPESESHGNSATVKRVDSRTVVN